MSGCTHIRNRAWSLTLQKSNVIQRMGLALTAFSMTLNIWSVEMEADSQPTEFDTIVITARKYEEMPMEVPLSLKLFTEKDIVNFGMATSSDIAAYTPNLQINSGFVSSVPSLFMRGIGIKDFNANANSAVGLYVDDVYASAASNQVFQLFDLNRVEVLRGPQGTLYGRNTTGGAINYIANKPTADFHGYTRMGYGRFEATSLEGMINIPVGETVATRISGISNQRDGVTKNLSTGGDVNDVDNWAGRLLLSAIPTHDIYLLLNIHGGQNRSTARFSQSQGLINGADELGYIEDPDPFKGSYNKLGEERLDSWGTSFSANWECESMTLTSISAFGEHDRLAAEDSDASPNQLLEVDFGDDGWQFSQELRLKSHEGETWDWLAGVYYLRDRLNLNNRYDIRRALRPTTGFSPASGVFLARQSSTQETESAAIFGEAGYHLFAHTRLTLGLRYTHETIRYATDNAFVEPGFSIPFLHVKEEAEYSAISGRIGIDHKPMENLLLYAMVSRGFNSGGVNGGIAFLADEVQPVDEETVVSYEIGQKSSWYDRRLELRTAVFYNDYSDLQVFILQSTGGIPREVLDNAADAATYGGEIEIDLRPTDVLEIQLGLGLLNSEYKHFVSGTNDFSGNEMVSSPEINMMAMIRYAIPIRAHGRITLQTDASYRDNAFFDTANSPRLAPDAYWLFNARIAYIDRENRYEIALWGKNLTDEEYLFDAFDLSDFGFDQLDYGDPRTFGIEVTVRF